MKKIFLLLVLMIFIISANAQYKAYINKKTKMFLVAENMKSDYQFFGYASNSLKSEIVILFSIFTDDVKNNPHKYLLGAYYGTSGLPIGDKIVFVSVDKQFVKLNYISASNKITPFYMDKKYIEFK